ncbi:hypothetical protein [Paraburkholderia hospita]|uniref:hypothetical protein n=1 Tax=Paraburkholderia hospita TaxID=169430 RepID=UPI0031346269
MTKSMKQRIRRAQSNGDAVWVIAPETAGVLGALCEAVGPDRWDRLRRGGRAHREQQTPHGAVSRSGRHRHAACMVGGRTA